MRPDDPALDLDPGWIAGGAGVTTYVALNTFNGDAALYLRDLVSEEISILKTIVPEQTGNVEIRLEVLLPEPTSAMVDTAIEVLDGSSVAGFIVPGSDVDGLLFRTSSTGRIWIDDIRISGSP